MKLKWILFGIYGILSGIVVVWISWAYFNGYINVNDAPPLPIFQIGVMVIVVAVAGTILELKERKEKKNEEEN